MPCKSGKLLVWDATCLDSFAPSYSAFVSVEAGLVAAQAEEREQSKYLHFATSHIFIPVVIETGNVFGPEVKNFIRELGHRLEQVTGDTTCVIPYNFCSSGFPLPSSGAIQLQSWVLWPLIILMIVVSIVFVLFFCPILISSHVIRNYHIQFSHLEIG